MRVYLCVVPEDITDELLKLPQVKVDRLADVAVGQALEPTHYLMVVDTQVGKVPMAWAGYDVLSKDEAQDIVRRSKPDRQDDDIRTAKVPIAELRREMLMDCLESEPEWVPTIVDEKGNKFALVSWKGDKPSSLRGHDELSKNQRGEMESKRHKPPE